MIEVEINNAGLARIEELEEECFATPWSAQSLLESLNLPYSHIYAYYDESLLSETGSNETVLNSFKSKPIGYIIFWQILDEIQLHRFGVNAKYRGQGYGKKILQTFLHNLKSSVGLDFLDITTVTLEVREHNHPALAVYEYCGFKKVGKRIGYYDDTGEAAILLDVVVNKI